MGKSTEPRKYINLPRRDIVYLYDASKVVIPNDMRVGARVFRAGSPVSDVLAAATAEYLAKPLLSEKAPEQEKTVSWVRYMYDNYFASYYDEETRSLQYRRGAKVALKELLDAFMATTLSNVDVADREIFEKRLKEMLLREDSK